MALDIQEGDYLVVDTKEYPIRVCQSWAWTRATAGIRRFATVQASTKRQPAVSAGKRGTPVTKLACIYCTPLDPASKSAMQEIQERPDLQSPHKLLETYVKDTGVFYRLVLEDLKK
jgi:hypothetical protein